MEKKTRLKGAELVKAIKNWALDNYGKGGDVIVECYTDAEIEAEFKSLTAAKRFCGIRKERSDEIRATVW